MEIEKKFAYYRKERGLNLREVSRDIIAPSTLSRFEQGKTHLSAVTFVQLINRLQVNWEKFVPDSRDLHAHILDELKWFALMGDQSAITAAMAEFRTVGGIQENMDYADYCTLLLVHYFDVALSPTDETIQRAMAQVLDTPLWSAFTVAIAHELVALTPIISLSALLAENMAQLTRLTDNRRALFTSGLADIQLDGILRLLRGGEYPAAQTAYEQFAGGDTEPPFLEGRLKQEIVQILLQAKSGESADFGRVTTILNSLQIMGAKEYLSSLVPLIQPLLEDAGMTTDLFDLPALYAAYGSHRQNP